MSVFICQEYLHCCFLLQVWTVYITSCKCKYYIYIYNSYNLQWNKLIKAVLEIFRIGSIAFTTSEYLFNSLQHVVQITVSNFLWTNTTSRLQPLAWVNQLKYRIKLHISPFVMNDHCFFWVCLVRWTRKATTPWLHT